MPILGSVSMRSLPHHLLGSIGKIPCVKSTEVLCHQR